jgi:UDP-N-acetylglucosamine kinase
MTHPVDSDNLGSAELRRIFVERIVPGLLAGQPQPEPVLIIVGGQPGAGKSRAQDTIIEQLGRRQAVVVDADDLRPYHPRYDSLALEDDITAAARTHPAASQWVDMALSYTIEQRYDIVYSTTMNSPEGTAARIAQARQAGYHVQAVIVGIHGARSRLGILDRYQSGHEMNGYGRYVPAEIHQRAYPGLLATADRIDREHLVDAVHVFLRSGEQVYHNSVHDGRWQQPAATRHAIEQARALPWTADEIAQFRDVAASLASRLPAELRADLAQAIATAHEHLRPGQAASSQATVDAAKKTAQAFRPGTDAYRPAPRPPRPRTRNVEPGRER